MGINTNKSIEIVPERVSEI